MVRPPFTPLQTDWQVSNHVSHLRSPHAGLSLSPHPTFVLGAHIQQSLLFHLSPLLSGFPSWPLLAPLMTWCTQQPHSTGGSRAIYNPTFSSLLLLHLLLSFTFLFYKWNRLSLVGKKREKRDDRERTREGHTMGSIQSDQNRREIPFIRVPVYLHRLLLSSFSSSSSSSSSCSTGQCHDPRTRLVACSAPAAGLACCSRASSMERFIAGRARSIQQHQAKKRSIWLNPPKSQVCLLFWIMSFKYINIPTLIKNKKIQRLSKKKKKKWRGEWALAVSHPTRFDRHWVPFISSFHCT